MNNKISDLDVAAVLCRISRSYRDSIELMLSYDMSRDKIEEHTDAGRSKRRHNQSRDLRA